MGPLLTSAPPAVEVINANGASPWVLLCEHASNTIPAHYNTLGLPEHELGRHIAWDIGALAIAQRLSHALDAPLIRSGYSRLLIDCNRPLDAPTSIPEISETTVIPGNIGIDQAERAARAELFYWPFQHAVAAHLDARQRAGRATIVFGVHTFTPVFKGFVRPWHAGVLFRKSTRIAEALISALSGPGLNIAANEPYQIEDNHDYTVPVHGEARGLDAILFEVRQELVAETAGVTEWSERLADALRRCADGSHP